MRPGQVEDGATMAQLAGGQGVQVVDAGNDSDLPLHRGDLLWLRGEVGKLGLGFV